MPHILSSSVEISAFSRRVSRTDREVCVPFSPRRCPNNRNGDGSGGPGWKRLAFRPPPQLRSAPLTGDADPDKRCPTRELQLLRLHRQSLHLNRLRQPPSAAVLPSVSPLGCSAALWWMFGGSAVDVVDVRLQEHKPQPIRAPHPAKI
ncbi:hypothetical protein MHYP_G00358620 [Metynnis hypsauchen]